MPNSLNFQKSITKELDIVKNRVRNIIGSGHWPEEGRYKELILKQAIKSQLPEHISIGTGFIIKEVNGNFRQSKQHDLILYDNRFPLIMKYGDFIVITPKNVKGIIEVKSNLSPAKFRDAFNKLESSLENVIDRYNKKFIGIFSYDFRNKNHEWYRIKSKNVINTLKYSKKIVNHISLGDTFFIRFWRRNQGNNLDPPVNANSDFFNIYKIDNLSYSYFISNIIHRICENINERYWHSYPIIDTKERYRITPIFVNED